jgi:L-ascorbate metabolism protein UlaG (beta-lactamase superfamily)
LSRFDLDIAILPINGTDEERLARNIAPNMFMDEAIMLAQDIDTKLLIPHHYDMFEHNTADVNEFIQLAEEAQQPYAVLEVGAKFIWKKA